MTDIAWRGFHDALDRLALWNETGDYKSPTPLADALHHLSTLENTVRVRHSDYFERRDSSADGRTVGGLDEYARNLLQHGGVDSIAIVGSRPFTLGRSRLGCGDTLGGPGVTCAWKPFAELPPPDRPEKYGRDAFYRDYVEGRNALETFADAKAFFSSL